MDYCEWGKEYLEEARRIRAHLAPLREELKGAEGEQQILLYRRVSMLGEICLECTRTGRYLIKKGERFHEKPTDSEP